jgi:hypothetical protein
VSFAAKGVSCVCTVLTNFSGSARSGGQANLRRIGAAVAGAEADEPERVLGTLNSTTHRRTMDARIAPASGQPPQPLAFRLLSSVVALTRGPAHR